MKKIIILLLGIIMLTGCGAAQKKETGYTCSFSEQGVESTVVFTSDGDKVNTSKTTMKINYDIFGIVDASMKAQLKETYESTYIGIEGVVISVSVDADDYLMMTIDVDFKVADRDYLIAAGLVEEDDYDGEFVSLKKIVASTVDNGYKCSNK